MCRHLAWLGAPGAAPRTLADVVLDPPHSLFRQSWAPRRQDHGTVNADGFGVGWYPPEAPGAPARYRRAVPVWADANLPELAGSLRSAAVLAAVRDATPGTSQDEAACAPYRHGRWLFSHNGAVPDWPGLPADVAAVAADAAPPPADLLRLEARCDSALLWAMAVRHLEAGDPPGRALAAVVARTAAARPAARLNLLLTDGRTAAATCWGDSLVWRATAAGVTVASEPDDDGDGWHDVPERTLLLATPGAVELIPLSAPLSASEPADATERTASA